MATPSSTHNKSFVLVELSSGSLGIGCGTITSPNAPTLVWNARLPFRGQVSREYETLERAAISALLEGSMQLAGEGVAELAKRGASLARAPFIFAHETPWSIGHITTMQQSYANPREVTGKDVKELIEKDDAVFETSEPVRTHADRTGSLVFLETQVVKIRANGYPLRDIRGISTRSFEATLFHSAIPKTLRDHCAEVAKKSFAGVELKHVSATYLFSLAQQVAHPEIERCLLIEVGSEVTVVSYMWNGSLSSTTWFLLGSRGLIDEVAKYARSAEEVRSVVELVCTKLQSNAAPDTSLPYSTWVHSLQDAVSEVLCGVSPPLHTYLLVDEEVGGVFMHLAKHGLDAVSLRPAQVSRLFPATTSLQLDGPAPPMPQQTSPADVALNALALGVGRLC